MMHLRLVCCAGTAVARTGAFAAMAAPLDQGGRQKASRLRLPGPGPDRSFTSPALAARETADAAAVAAAIEPRLADIDHGEWADQSFATVRARDPAGFDRWLAAPEHGAPGGETLAGVVRRIGPWLDEQAAAGGGVAGITHPMVVRAALCVALGMPPAVTMRIDLAPLCIARLSFHRGWRLQSLSTGG